MASKVKFDQIEAATPGGDITVGSPLKDSQGAAISGVRLLQRGTQETNISFGDSGIVVPWSGDIFAIEVGAAFGSWDASYEEFTFSETGIYRIEAYVSANGGGASNRTTVKVAIEIDEGAGYSEPLNGTFGYLRDVSGEATKVTTTGQSLIVNPSVGVKARVSINRSQGSASCETATNGTYILIQRLGDA